MGTNLNNIELKDKKKIIGWGTGSYFKSVFNRTSIHLDYLVDNDESKVGKEINGLQVFGPEQILNENSMEVVIVVYSSFYDEIYRQIKQMGNYDVIAVEQIMEQNEQEAMTQAEKDLIARQFWDNKREYKGVDLNHWGSNDLIVSIINNRLCGPQYNNWVQYIRENYLKEKLDLKVLSLGCGTGHLERILLKELSCKLIDAIDFSPLSIKEAKNRAELEGFSEKINYQIDNLNEVILDANKYDLIVAEESIHHISNLEHLYQQVNSSLKSDGIFVQNEFTGPNHFQWTDEQLSEINGILELISPKYKIRDKFNRPTLDQMLRTDPSEAVRSSDIIPLTYDFFNVLEQRNVGGNIMHLLYQCLNTDYFHFNRSAFCEHLLISLMEYEEKVFLSRGISDAAMLIAQKKTIEE
ncbi:class I SAM-dependent methyltransferase [Cohnella massiliensis]|uniref:class I SAM-dependent methyltransferase n=1 Tax=Cohnella massiliensis TaxID=1816691 RepID=UPI0009BC7082|nr:class I SAM-dependent methyltransferase [Cohnella massiliensis]